MGAGSAVHFFTADQARLAGVLTLPDGASAARRVPAVLLCQGLSGVKHLVLPEVAARFRAAGLAALAFDYRGYGDSAGEPGWVLPVARVEDALHAFAYLAQRPEVDPGRLGVYGLSLGGPIAVALAAAEPRARAVVSVSGPANLERLLRSLRTSAEWLAFKTRVEADRAQRATTGRSTLVGIEEIIPFSPSFQAKYSALQAGEASSALAPKSGSDAPPRYWFASADALLQFHAEDVVPRLAPRPLLLVHGERDDVATVEQGQALYARAPSNAQLVIVPGLDHVDLDAGPGLAYQIGLAIDWFHEYLPT